MKLEEIANKIYEKIKNEDSLYNPNCYVAGSKINICYVSYQSNSSLTKKEALVYLDFLEKNKFERHYKVIDDYRKEEIKKQIEQSSKEMFTISKITLKHFETLDISSLKNKISRKKIIKETPKIVHYIDALGENILTDNKITGEYMWFNSEKEARNYFLSFLERKIESLKEKTEKLEKIYEEIITED